MELELDTQSTEAVTVVQDESGLWLLQELSSGRVSNELFASLKVANMALEGEYFTWDDNTE